MLELRGVVKHYSSAGNEVVRALDGVSMSVGAGELVALYGPSGSGKTTLLSIVAALVPADRGEVLLDGREVPITSVREAARYRRLRLGYVSQSPDLLPGVSAIDNAALKLFALRLGVGEAHRRVAPLLKRLTIEPRSSPGGSGSECFWRARSPLSRNWSSRMSRLAVSTAAAAPRCWSC